MSLDYALIGFLAVAVAVGLVFFVNVIKNDTKKR